MCVRAESVRDDVAAAGFGAADDDASNVSATLVAKCRIKQ